MRGTRRRRDARRDGPGVRERVARPGDGHAGKGSDSLADFSSHREKIVQAIVEASDKIDDVSLVTAETTLQEDLGLGSLQAVTLIMDLEDAFDMTVEDEELEGLGNVGDVFRLIEAKLDATG